MQAYQKAFLDFALDVGVLRFGEFTLKSGRISPYFFNAGLFNSGSSLARLGRYYAQTIVDSGIEFDVLFGPAYKGIPLAAITASALYQHHGYNIPYAFDRKEIKDHGEGGRTVGSPVRGRVMIIDDVITAGTAIRQTMQLIESLGAKVSAVTIALDRQERGLKDLSAIQELEQLGIRVISIIQLDDIIQYLSSGDQTSQLQAVATYRQQYGSD